MRAAGIAERDTTFISVMDATLKGSDTVFILLRSYVQRLMITQADQVLFIAEGAPWIWKPRPPARASPWPSCIAGT